MITWFIGMSGSGKTTLANAIYKRLKPGTQNLVYLDGDEFREIFRNDVDHTVEGRLRNAERISHFCRVLDQQNIHVIAAVLSIFPDWQRWNRKISRVTMKFSLMCPCPFCKNEIQKGSTRKPAPAK